MPAIYSIEEVKKDKYVFLSYSHKDKEIVTDWATWLIDEGVRLWYDPDFVPGHKWEEEMRKLLAHENCCGAIFFCSPDALVSSNVHKEREEAMKQQKLRGEKEYVFFVVNVTRDSKPVSYMQMVKKTCDCCEEEKLDKEFPFDHLKEYIELGSNGTINVSTHDEAEKERLFKGINKLIEQVINKSVRAYELLEEAAHKASVVSIRMGRYCIDGELRPIIWKLMHHSEEIGYFLAERILTNDYGESIEQRLNEEFKTTAFSAREASLLQGRIRLLTREECEQLQNEPDGRGNKLLNCGKPWWLADETDGYQMTVEEDGSIFDYGYDNADNRWGIRPVIAVKMEDAHTLV